MSGSKYDAGKPELHLIPSCALYEAARAAMMGKYKYGKWNYKQGLEWTRLIDAALRHIRAFADGKDINVEEFTHIDTGEQVTEKAHHLGHAIINLAFLLDYYYNGLGTDDRWKSDKNTEVRIESQTMEEILSRNMAFMSAEIDSKNNVYIAKMDAAGNEEKKEDTVTRPDGNHDGDIVADKTGEPDGDFVSFEDDL